MKKVILVLVSLLILTGCNMKEDFELSITKDGKMIFVDTYQIGENVLKLAMGATENMMTGDSSSITNPSLTDMENYFYESMDISEDQRNSYKSEYEDGTLSFTKQIISENITDNVKPKQDEEYNKTLDILNLTKDAKIFEKSDNTYTADFVINFFDDINLDELQGEEYLDYLTEAVTYDEMLELNLKVTLPYKAKTNNADQIEDDGKTLIWKLNPSTTNNIKFTFSLDKESNKKISIISTIKNKLKSINKTVYIIIAGAVVVLITLIILIKTIFKKNKKDDFEF